MTTRRDGNNKLGETVIKILEIDPSKYLKYKRVGGSYEWPDKENICFESTSRYINIS